VCGIVPTRQPATPISRLLCAVWWTDGAERWGVCVGMPLLTVARLERRAAASDDALEVVVIQGGITNLLYRVDFEDAPVRPSRPELLARPPSLPPSLTVARARNSCRREL